MQQKIENAQRGIMAISAIYSRNAKMYITKTKMQKTMLHEMPPLITRRWTMFFMISRKHSIYRQYILTGIIMKNFEISSEHNHARNNHAIKSIKEIVKSVSKFYRKHAYLLMKLLFQKAVPDRISWDEHGIVTIDGNVVKDSNISVINDAIRERKTVKIMGL